MHTLSIFPELLTYGMIAPLLLRLVSALFLASIAKEKYQKNNWLFTIPCTIVATLLAVGLYTQIVVLVGLVLVKLEFWTEKKKNTLSKEKMFLFVVIEIILVSLLFTGPGFLAFDLPL